MANSYANTVCVNVKYGCALRPYHAARSALENPVINVALPDDETVGGEKIFATSDIEGNYYAITKPLIVNEIVDEKLNRTFMNEHLGL